MTAAVSAASQAPTAAFGSTATKTLSASASDPVQEQIRQLNDARKLVLANVNYYPTIVQGILPILSPSSLPPLRRWGADFLAEAFAAPALPSREKETLGLLVLESLKGMVENAGEDTFVLQSIVQAAASIYPLVIRWIINNSYDTPTWERMTAIKSCILRLWESPLPSIQICCIKFAQRVVLAQTHGISQEQKRDGLDISLNLVPANHALLDPRHLEAEATGLLDRMLSVLQDNNSDALIVDATLNTLSVLVRTRPSTVSRIMNAVLNFNPLKLATNHMTARTRVVVKSMEKTTRMLLIHLTKRDPQNASNGRIHQYLERLMRTRAEVFDEAAGRKRTLADQQMAAYGDAKRQRMAIASNAEKRPADVIPPLAAGQNSLADIFALTSNAQLRSFNAGRVPLDLAAKVSVSTLVRIDQQLLDRAIQGIRGRLATLEAASAQPLNPDTAPLDVEDDDDDDYEPDLSMTEDTEQILNKLDMDSGSSGQGMSGAAGGVGPGGGILTAAAAAAAAAATSSLALGAFHLPAAPQLTSEQVARVGQAAVARVFDTMQSSEEAAVPTGTRAVVRKAAADGATGLNRVAGSSFNRESWTTILTRLATRPLSSLERDDEAGAEDEDKGEGGEGEEERGESKDVEVAAIVKSESAGKDTADKKKVQSQLNDNIRESLFRFVLEDFRKRIDVAVAWLCEEWYNDQLEKQYALAPEAEDGAAPHGRLHYDEWSVRLLDAFVPYLHGQDNKVLTRFLSEIPALSPALLQRVKNLCRDPSMVPVALTSILYQLMMRPPARALALDTLEEVWTEFEDARPMATKYLDKWRPGFVQRQTEAASQQREAADPDTTQDSTSTVQDSAQDSAPDTTQS